jgi:hypothetical protein
MLQPELKSFAQAAAGVFAGGAEPGDERAATTREPYGSRFN